MTRRPDDTDLAIVRLVATGHTNVAIAGRLHLSRDTIAHRLTQLMSWAGALNRAHLVTLAISSGTLAVNDLVGRGGCPMRAGQVRSSARSTIGLECVNAPTDR